MYLEIRKWPDYCGQMPGCRGCPVAEGVDRVTIEGESLTQESYSDALREMLGVVPANRHILSNNGRWVRADVKALSVQPKNPRKVNCAEGTVSVVFIRSAAAQSNATDE